ncbi:MAG: enoyl-CoA hydratase [Betaproteobacteria bacterium]|nr:MAG: enoyl-CoA hydratase [Betaproteobacteria bacterium]
MTTDSSILVEAHATLPGVVNLTLNRPQALNSLNRDMSNAFTPAIQKVLSEPGVRVMILQGAGAHFMAGGDIKGFGETLGVPGPERRKHYFDMIGQLHAGVELLQRSEIITICKIRGACAGIGMSFAIGCDLTIASDDAYFTTAYKVIGLTPDGGQSFFLPRLVGVKKAMELTLLSERISAAEALSLGLLNRVVPGADLDAATDKLATQIIRSSPESMRGIKRLINTSMQSSFSEQLEAERESFSKCAGTDNFAEGIRAFIEKRHPKFE